MRILLIEDDEMIGAELVMAAKRAGYAVDWVQDAAAGRVAIRDHVYTCVLLDLGLPRGSGMDILQTTRASGDRTPILIITARDAVADRVEGLNAGADDYLVKPFEFRELEARMRAVIRRRDGHAQSLIGTSELQLDLSARQVIHNGARASISAREFALLHALLERPGSILSREQLEDRIYSWRETVSSNVVEVVIHGLRKRFGADLIRNVRGLGWRIPKGNT